MPLAFFLFRNLQMGFKTGVFWKKNTQSFLQFGQRLSGAEIESVQPVFSLPTQCVAGGKSDEEITACRYWFISVCVCVCKWLKPESSSGICIFNAVLARATVEAGGKISKAVPDVLLLLSQRTTLQQKKKKKKTKKRTRSVFILSWCLMHNDHWCPSTLIFKGQT